jgi:hypothetical protein
MKTTVELPDGLFREAKATAAWRGASLKDFFREAVEEKLRRDRPKGNGRLASTEGRCSCTTTGTTPFPRSRD